MRGKIIKGVKKSSNNSLNYFIECFFTRFTRVTGTEIGKAKRSKVYNIDLAINSFK